MKTIPEREFLSMKKSIARYHKYMSTHPHTLIAKYFGLHKLTLIPKKGIVRRYDVYFVIMENIFRTVRELHMKFDLKGSTKGRITKLKQGESVQYKTLKDLNWRELGNKISLDEKKAESLKEILYNDSQFLSSINVIDYSLLIGIHLKKGIGESDYSEKISQMVGDNLDDKDNMIELISQPSSSRLEDQKAGIFSPMPEIKFHDPDGKVFKFGDELEEEKKMSDEENFKLKERQIEVIFHFF